MAEVGPYKSIDLRVRSLEPSATLRINELANRLISEGKDVVKFGLGQSPFPVPEPVVQALRENARERDYLPVAGLPALREAFARYISSVTMEGTGQSYDAEDILVGPGTKELMYILQSVYYSETLLPRPSWVSYAPQAKIVGKPIIWLETKVEEDWVLQPETLERHCAKDPDKPRLLILNTPANPTGTTYPEDKIKALAAVCRKYRILVLSDEIYAALEHQDQHVSPAKYYPEGTIISNGLSKWCGAGGWRIGLWAFPKSLAFLRASVSIMAAETFSCVASPLQFAAVRAYDLACPLLSGYVRRQRRIVSLLGQWCARQLRSQGLSLASPTAAFYLFVDFSSLSDLLLEKRKVTDDSGLCSALLEEKGVAFLPGSAFGCPPAAFLARIAYVDFDGGAALDAIDSLPEHVAFDCEEAEVFVRSHCGRVVSGIERICQWIEELH